MAVYHRTIIRCLAVALLATVCSLATRADEPAPTSTGSISGTVAEADGKAVAKVEVKLFHARTTRAAFESPFASLLCLRNRRSVGQV